MKRWLCVVLACVLLLCGSACAGDVAAGDTSMVMVEPDGHTTSPETLPATQTETEPYSLKLTGNFYLQAANYLLQYPFGDFTALTAIRQRLVDGDNWVLMFVVWLDGLAAEDGSATPMNLAQYQMGEELRWEVPVEEAWDAMYAWYGIDYVLQNIRGAEGSHYDAATGNFIFTMEDPGWNEARRATRVTELLALGSGTAKATVAYTSEVGEGEVVLYVRQTDTEDGSRFTLLSVEGTNLVHGL